MKTMRYLTTVVCLLATFCVTIGCKEEEKVEPQTDERTPMAFTLMVETRSGHSAETYSQITEGFWLRVTSASGTSLYDGWANVMDGVVSLEDLQAGETLEWPEDETEKVNIVAIFDNERLYAPLSVTLNYDYAKLPLDYLWYGDNGLKDLLVAHLIVSKSECSGGVVNLNFQHALSLIRTSVKISDPRHFYALDRVSVTTPEQAAYYFSPTDPTEDKWVSFGVYERAAEEKFKAVYGEEAYDQYVDDQGGYFLEEGMMEENSEYYIFDSDDGEYDLGVPSSTGVSSYSLLLNKELPEETPLQRLVVPLNVIFNLSYSLYTYTQDGTSYTKGDMVRSIEGPGFDLGLQPTGKSVLCTVKVNMVGNSISIGGVDEEGRTMD